MNWNNKRVLITGGAAFIGSHLTEALLQRGAKVLIADNLSSTKEWIGDLQKRGAEFMRCDLRDEEDCNAAMLFEEVVFHLAADHGGRGYVDTHQAGPASNFLLDAMVINTALAEGVEKFVFASSGCVYPNYKQTDVTEELYLREEDVGPPYEPDNMYGWAKLVAEETMRAYHRERGFSCASCRFFTVYGPRMKEDHAVGAFVARARAGATPYEVWGDGTALRNWTHVSDIVRGLILAAERVTDGTAINLGTRERISVADAARLIMREMGHEAPIEFLPNAPVGPANRIACYDLATRLLGWQPNIAFTEGIKGLAEWYRANRTPEDAARRLNQLALAA